MSVVRLSLRGCSLFKGWMDLSGENLPLVDGSIADDGVEQWMSGKQRALSDARLVRPMRGSLPVSMVRHG